MSPSRFQFIGSPAAPNVTPAFASIAWSPTAHPGGLRLASNTMNEEPVSE